MAESVACQSCSKNAAFQLSLCYAFGFGVSQNDQECNAWLIRSGKEYSDITATIERIKQAEPDAAFLAGIAKIGYRTDLPSRYRQDGILPVAIDHYRSIIEARWRCFGPSHFSTLRLQGLLVKLLRWNNMQQEALELALEILEQGWLKKPADNVEMKSTVSLIYHELGDDFNAEAMEREVLNTYESEQWKGHTERLDSQSNLVDILISRGQYKDAIELGQSTVEECLAELGSYHTSTRASRRSLVAAHIRCGELTQAVRITEELVQSEEPKSKSDYVNPKLVEDVSILGLLYYRLDMIAPALRCYDRIQNWVEHNTANATYAVNSVNNQATKLIQQGAMKEAKVILENLLPECEKALGQETEETALVMGNLVFIYHSERNWEKAEPLGRAVIETRRLVLGPSHPNSITAMGNYRSMLLDQGKVTRAVEVANEEIECIREGKGSTNESIIDSILTIAGDFMTHKAFKETVVFLQRVIAMKGAEPRDPQQRILQAMALQSICYLHIGMLDEARQAIFILLVSFQDPFKEHLNTFVPELLRLAKTCLSMNHLVEGEQVLVGATIISQKSTNLRDVVKDELKAVLSQYLERKGLESMQLSFNPYVVMDLSKQERRGGEQNFEERQIH
jgi:tetratricopeptide (TPR) repeat protein